MGGRVVRRAYRYRFYPTPEQAEQLNRTFGCVRYVYHRALAERSRAWTQEQRRVTHAETDKMLTGWKQDPETAWLAEPSKGPLQAALRNLQGAFDRFWRKQNRYPRFKLKGRSRDSATYFRNCFTFRDGRVKLAKQSEPLDIRWSRPLPEGAEPSQVTVSRNAGGSTTSRSWSRRKSPRTPRRRRRWGWMPGSPPWSRCRAGRRSPTRSTRRKIGPGSPRLSAPWPGTEGLGQSGQGPTESGQGVRPDHRPAPGSPAQAHHSIGSRKPSDRDRGSGCPEYGEEPIVGAGYLGCVVGGAAPDIGVQGRLVRPRGDRDRPVVSEQQDLLGLGSSTAVDVVERPGMDLPRLWGGPRPGHQTQPRTYWPEGFRSSPVETE
jgi:hypothetical protein